MDKSKRTVLIRSMISLALLLVALIIFVVVLVVFSATYGLPLTSDGEVGWLVLAAVLVAASTSVGCGAVAASVRGLDKRTGAVRRRSMNALLCLLSIILLLVPASLVLDTGNKDPGGECVYDYATCIGRPLVLGVGVFVLAIAPLLIVGLIFTIGAVSSGLARAATLNNSGWLAGLLVYVIGSLVGAVAASLLLAQNRINDTTTQFAMAILILLPFLTPVITLTYSFFGRLRSEST
jgi:hypothetical protein